jgi:hypothetical protein
MFGAKAVGLNSASLNEGRQLVVGFVEYATKVVNEDMKDFFESNLDLFDQDDSEITDGTGHTLEQYEIFQKYESILERKIDEFSVEKGFSNSVSCFEAIQDALTGEKSAHKNLMSDLQKQFASMRKALLKSVEKTDAEADSKTNDEDGSSSAKGGEGKGASKDGSDDKSGGADAKNDFDDDGDAKSASKAEDSDNKGEGGKGTEDEDEDELPPLEPVPMLFAPLPLERMLESILKLSEYSTFSQIMRTKVKQQKFARSLATRIRRHPEDIKERENQLSRGGHYLEADELFGWLQKRLSELLPEGVGFDGREGIYQFLDKETWTKVISRDILETNEQKLELKRLISFTFGHLQRMGLIEDFMLLRRIAVELMQDIDTGEMNVTQLATKFLRLAHENVDAAEKALYKAFVDHKLIKAEF